MTLRSPTTSIRKTWTFDAAHQLPNHEGKCSRPHGHTYSVTVELTGEPQPTDGRSEEGMVRDFAALDDVWAPLKDMLDHRDLNVTLEAAGYVRRTTSELIADFLFRAFERPFGEQLASVTVSETAATSATVRR